MEEADVTIKRADRGVCEALQKGEMLALVWELMGVEKD